ncbi:hypothetical protein ZEAMMB73_Zm00001d037496 [Zea mays]|uniref:Uncharacterized protein n=1 Tax=Zea mays TaxID=4577 RepID=A0A1D6LY92_MAIZE|nr:hypothetical protein ZEAMMB73_Zm00001d037496 [Zea mays]
MVVSTAPAAIPICARLLRTVIPDPNPTKHIAKRSQKSAFSIASRNRKSSPLLGLLLFGFIAPSPSAKRISMSVVSSSRLPRNNVIFNGIARGAKMRRTMMTSRE